VNWKDFDKEARCNRRQPRVQKNPYVLAYFAHLQRLGDRVLFPAGVAIFSRTLHEDWFWSNARLKIIGWNWCDFKNASWELV
jgi:hypothetical protein